MQQLERAASTGMGRFPKTHEVKKVNHLTVCIAQSIYTLNTSIYKPTHGLHFHTYRYACAKGQKYVWRNTCRLAVTVVSGREVGLRTQQRRDFCYDCSVGWCFYKKHILIYYICNFLRKRNCLGAGQLKGRLTKSIGPASPFRAQAAWLRCGEGTG